MWDKFKNKVLDLFTVEVEVENEEVSEKQHETKKVKQKDMLPPVQYYRKQTEAKAKMTYQYPKDRSFRFPAIPDQTKENDVQIQHRRGIERANRKQTHQNLNNQANEVDLREERRKRNHRPIEQRPKPGIERRQKEVVQQKDDMLLFKQTHKSETKKTKPTFEKRSSKPFQPTQVASPIYGYHSRDKMKEVEEKPAYVRRQAKREARNQQELKQPIAQNVTDDSINFAHIAEKANFPHIEPVKAVQEEHASEQETLNFGDEVLDLHPHIEEVHIDELASIEKEAEENTVTKEAQIPQHYNQMIEEFTKAEKEGNPLPFNVIMTGQMNKAQEEGKVRSTKTIQSVTDEVSIINEAVKVPSIHDEQVEEVVHEDIPFHLLNDPDEPNQDDADWILEQQELLEQTLMHFNVKAKVVNATQGPSVTRFEVQPELGVKVSKVRNLSDDLKLNMSAQDIRIEAPIPGKNTIGIEIPNRHAQMVGLQEIFESDAFQETNSPLTVGLGLSIEGTPIVTDINKMPHGLIAGATGSGKSVCINTILVSLLYKATHEDVRLMLIDPKMVELAPYNGIPHLVAPVITDVKAATAALKWAVAEMEERYEKFVLESVRDISRYNEKMRKASRLHEKMPFLVIVIDELADLMMISPQDVEDSICRIAQKARACGIHLLLATQRPSVDVITGLIKANIPTRIAFSVSSQVDSRTIIDTSGAERLLGKGDMLFVENGAGKSIRIQGAFVSDEEIERVTNYARTIAPPNYLFEQEELLAKVQVDEETDELLQAVIEFIIEENQASTSLLQRQFRIGYNRAARLMDTLEKKGFINQQNGSKPRDVLISRAQLNEMLQ